jgi:uncharacterized RmlC-like cupin family protein
MSSIPPLTAGVTKAGAGLGVTWNILGSPIRPVIVSPDTFAFFHDIPPGGGVPPHVHHSQDEFIHILSGRLDYWLDGAEGTALSGDIVRMPKGVPHGVSNRSDATVASFWWVTPTARLYDLFRKIDGMPDPKEVMRLSSLHEVDFLPPK